MLRAFYFLIFFYSSPVFATLQYTTSVYPFNVGAGTYSDLNEAYFACSQTLISSNDVCLWFAEGDVISLFDGTSDTLVTINPGHDGWYRLRKTLSPVAPEIPNDSAFYLGQYFEVNAVNRATFRTSPQAIIDNQKDYRGRYEGFRDIEACPSGSDTSFYPAYTGSARNFTANASFHQITINEYDTYISASPVEKTFCTVPTSMGHSCPVTYSLASVYSPISSVLPNTAAVTFNVAAYLTPCAALPLQGFPARLFLTGVDKPTLFNPVFPDEIINSNLVEFQNVDTSGNLISSGYSISSVLYTHLFDVVPPVVDTDGDGVPDSQDAFPNDPLESVDSDGDGVGDNSDPFPNDSTNGGSGSGSDIAGTGGDTTDPFTQPGDPIVTGTGDGASGSCAVEPVCSGTPTECALLKQVWISNCKLEDVLGSDNDDSVDGGASCDSAPICTGDIIQCSILANNWRDRCDEKNDALDFIDANGGSTNIDNNFSTGDVTTNIDFSTSTPVSDFFGYSQQSGTCPADRVINLSVGSFIMPWTTFCDFASSLAPLILAMAYLVGTRNIFNAYVGT